MTKKSLVAAALLGGASLGLSGCPTAPGTYAIYLVNTSDSFTVTNLRVVDTSDASQFEEYPDDVAPNRTHVINNIPLDVFAGDTIRVEIDAETGGDIFDDGEFDVTIPDVVESGSVFVIAVSGDISLNFGAEYVALDDSSKGALITKGYLPPIK